MKFDDHMAGGEAVDDLVRQEGELGAFDIDEDGGRSRALVDDLLQFRGIRLAANIHPVGNAVQLCRMADALPARGPVKQTDCWKWPQHTAATPKYPSAAPPR